ncbi:MAG TPA: hypothetical protein V6D00_12155 [Pantanalinema sp.]
MRLVRPIAASTLCLLLCACASPALRALSPATGDGPAADAPAAMGQLVITVRWPRQIQLIPYSANLIRVRVLDANASLLVSHDLEKAAGNQTSQAQLAVPAGDDLRVEVKAYQDFDVVAEGAATASVKVNQRQPLAVHLAPRFVPALSAYPLNAGPGATIELVGSGFGAAANKPVSVTFDGLEAPGLYRVDEERLRVTVPEGVASGSIVVRVDGVPSEPSGAFWTLSALSAIAPFPGAVTLGQPIALSVSASSSAGPEPAPNVEWTLLTADQSGATLPAEGTFFPATGSSTVFTATGTGSAILSVRSGRLVSTASLEVIE